MNTNALIAAQNDAFRKAIAQMDTTDDIPKGKVVMTRGIAEQSPDFQLELTRRVIAYAGFNEDCDPDETHEMGVISIEGETVWFKIDLYGVNYEYGSEVPEEVEQTRRVLTMLFPSEY